MSVAVRVGINVTSRKMLVMNVLEKTCQISLKVMISRPDNERLTHNQRGTCREVQTFEFAASVGLTPAGQEPKPKRSPTRYW